MNELALLDSWFQNFLTETLNTRRIVEQQYYKAIEVSRIFIVFNFSSGKFVFNVEMQFEDSDGDLDYKYFSTESMNNLEVREKTLRVLSIKYGLRTWSDIYYEFANKESRMAFILYSTRND